MFKYTKNKMNYNDQINLEIFQISINAISGLSFINSYVLKDRVSKNITMLFIAIYTKCWA
jgi:hypothetical protein